MRPPKHLKKAKEKSKKEKVTRREQNSPGFLFSLGNGAERLFDSAARISKRLSKSNKHRSFVLTARNEKRKEKSAKQGSPILGRFFGGKNTKVPDPSEASTRFLSEEKGPYVSSQSTPGVYKNGSEAAFREKLFVQNMRLSAKEKEVRELQSEVEELHKATKTTLPRVGPLHDKLRQKFAWYRSWHQKQYSSKVHSATALAFVTAFVISLSLQLLFPYLFTLKPQPAQAGTNSATWTTQSHFENNAAPGSNYTGATTMSQVDTSTIAGQVALQKPANNSANLMLFWDGGAAPAGWSIVSDPGGPFYQRFPRGAATFGSTGGNDTHSHTYTGPLGNANGYHSVLSTGTTVTVGDQNHNHTPLSGTTNVVSNLPLYKNLRVIKYNSGVPTAVPTGAIGVFDSTLPTGWTRYSAQDNYFVRLDSSAGGAGGSNTHSHTLSITTPSTAAPTTTTGSGSSQSFTTTAAHYHTWNPSIASSDNQPPFRAVVFAKADTNTGIPTGLIGMFDNAPATIWTVVSGSGGALDGLFIKGSTSYGGTGGSATHIPPSVTGPTSTQIGGGSVTGATGTSSKWGAWSNHQHDHPSDPNDIFSAESNLPPYTNVVFAKYSPSYNSPGTISGLRIDGGTGKANWDKILWNATTADPAKYKVKFRTRGSDLADPSGASITGDPATGWTYWNNDSLGTSYYSTSGSDVLTVNARWLDIEATLESTDGLDTPILNDFSVTYDYLPDVTGVQMGQGRADTGTAISANGWTNETSVKLKAQDYGGIPGSSTKYKSHFEVVPSSSSFNTDDQSTTNVTQGDWSDAGGRSPTLSAGSYSEATISGLTVGQTYKWRAKIEDQAGRISGWSTDNANNLFSTETTAPTGTVSINSAATYTSSTSVTLTLSASDTGGSGLSQMQISNDGTFDTEPWEAYATSKAWTLDAGDGTKTVYVRFRDGAGNESATVTSSQTGIVGFWKMNGTIGNIANGANVTATVGTNATAGNANSTGMAYQNGLIDQAINFDGTDDNAQVSDGGALLPATVSGEAKIKIPTYPAPAGLAGTIFAKYDNATNAILDYGGYTLQINTDGKPVVTIQSNTINVNTAITAPQAISLNEWHRVAFSYTTSTTTLTLFVDGISVASTGSAVTMGGTNNPFEIGRLSNKSAATYPYTYFNGLIDEVAIYNRALTATEVANIANDSITLDSASPAAFDLSTPSNNSWQQSASPTLNWNASSDANGLSKYQLWIDGVLDTDNIPSGTTSSAPTTPLSAGSHTWHVKAFDNAGNITQSTSTYNIGYDATVPSLALDPGFTFTASDGQASTITLNWNTYADDSGSGAPAQTYSLERLKNADYQADSQTLTSNWSTSASYYNIGDKNSSTFSHIDTVGVNPENIEDSVKYIYRVKVTDSAGNISNWLVSDTGLNADTVAPTSPVDITVTACDGTAPNCFDIGNRGYEQKVAWTVSTDTGSGVARYLVWRTTTPSSTNQADYALVGVAGALANSWWDNDANNAAFDGTYKTAASGNLTDYQMYYYRVTAQDGATPANESQFVPANPLINNLGNGRTVDITAPTVTQIGGVTPNSITEIQVDWSQWPDKSSRDNSINGAGVTEYVVERSYDGATNWIQVGDLSGTPPTNQLLDTTYDGYDFFGQTTTIPSAITAGSPANGGNLGVADASVLAASGRIQIDSEYVNYTSKTGNTLNNITRGAIGSTAADHSGGATVYKIDRFKGLQAYYYRMKAKDASLNWSGYTGNTSNSTASTPDATAPTAPTLAQATSTKGDPAGNADVGHKVTLSWTGSQDNGLVQGYKIYRSTDGSLTTNQWLALAPVKTITSADSGFSNLPIQDDTGNQRTWTDTGLTDGTTYYYRIVAYDNANPTALNSSLSATSTPTTKSFDTTPDDTAPATPEEVKIQAIWGANPGDIRIVVTWQKVVTPLRAGANDFKEYRVYKSTDNVSFSQILVSGQNPLYSANKTTAIESNYYVDSQVLSDGTTYYYYVTGVDDAGTEFKYASPPFDAATVINAYNNESAVSQTASLNPQQVIPQVNLLSNGKKSQITAVGVSSATLHWETNQTTDSVVEYRKAGTTKFITAGDTDSVTAHNVSLSALEAGATYEYRVLSRNAIGNVKKVGFGQADDGVGDNTTGNDDVQTLTTSSFSISGISADTTTTTATVKWSTGAINADSNVEYRAETAPGEAQEQSQVSGDPASKTSHSVVIKALKPNRVYTYKIRSVTSDKYVSETQFLTFQTKPFDSSQFVIAPDASAIAEQSITATSAKITWKTDVATTSWLDYGTASSNYTFSAGDNKYNANHVVELLNLTPGTTYYYKVRGKDTNDIEYTSKEYTFTAVLLPQISGVKVEKLSHNSTTITWTTNTNTDSLIEFGPTASYGSSKGDPTATKTHSVTLDNLEQDTLHHFRAVSVDSASNKTASPDATFTTTKDTTAPAISGLKQDIIRTTNASGEESIVAIVSWSTDEEATSQVEYGLGLSGTYNSITTPDETLKKSHTIILSNLKPATTYHFRANSKDKYQNEAKSDDATIITPAKQQSIFQKIIKALEESFSWVNNLRDYLRDKFDKIF